MTHIGTSSRIFMREKLDFLFPDKTAETDLNVSPSLNPNKSFPSGLMLTVGDDC